MGAESVLRYSCEVWTVDYRLNGKRLSTDTDFWRRAARRSKILEVRSEITREKKGSNTNCSHKNGK
jgi:hypothetical protein